LWRKRPFSFLLLKNPDKKSEYVKADDNQFDVDGQLRNGEYREYFKDDSLSCEGVYLNGEKTGEWRYYFA
jgi:antitoxin component YwqK of YwqJK toxin-antitoxin module